MDHRDDSYFSLVSASNLVWFSSVQFSFQFGSYSTLVCFQLQLSLIWLVF